MDEERGKRMIREKEKAIQIVICIGFLIHYVGRIFRGERKFG